ncbi:hypothetical protein MN086_00145 [Sulfurovum sp. XGS-02]|uniref:hypothetical protein n=1 Tax=Sulfurovum sp. XGS-02 TaxID=2925411 RepID=UPI00205DCCFF|nr:hypothetical protein [Sulfurovum sp. XGS-02]UPT77582.1 hypothetical protein MN086_00145 [Sulfurovum sp. XGS-02]
MQMVKKSGIVLIVAWFAILVMMPKQAFYYKLEEALAEQEIKLNEEKIDEGFFSLKLHQVTVYFKGIPVATIEEMGLCTLLFYSSLELQGLHVDDSLKRMVPQETKQAWLSHSILSPLEVSVDAEGSFGGLTGTIDLNARTVHLDFNESKHIEMLKPQLKKSEKGWFYETSF